MNAQLISRRTVSVWQGNINLQVQIKGSGAPILYLHPAGGMSWDPFLDDLASDHTVFAPEFPGTSPDDNGAIHQLDDIFDAVLVYEEAVRVLGIEGATVIGQSFGGMLAAELASAFPALFAKVVLLDPPGLWSAEQPYSTESIAGPPESMPGLLFHDPTCPGAQAMFAPAETFEETIDNVVNLVWAIGCTAKFLWPIPDRGLHKRLHRLAAPTLIVWGEQDSFIPVWYAHEFARRIAGSELVIVPNSGHIPQVEQTDLTTAAVRRLLTPR